MMNAIFTLNPGMIQNNQPNQDKLALYRIVIISLVILVTGCVPTTAVFSPNLPTPLRKAINTKEISATQEMNIVAEEPISQIRFKPTPSLPVTTATTSSTQLSETDFFPHFAKIAPVSVNVEGLPLPAFINEVFGNLLGLSFEIDNPVQQRTELVTLRAKEAQSPQQLYQLAQQVLANYGVAIQLQGDFLRFTATKNQPPNPLPTMIVQGLTLPEVPPSHRPVFQFVPGTHSGRGD